MHYYQHNIGDYRRDTSHLSLLEHGVYRQLLDTYYLSESPIPTETEVVFRRLSARTDEEKKAVLDVLNEFFFLGESGWIHSRCDKEIAVYQGRVHRARVNGKLGGRPEKTKVVISRNLKETETKANQELINQLTNKPIINKETTSLSDRSRESRLNCPVEKLVDIYHEVLPTCPRVAVMTKTRQAYAASRWREVCHADKWETEAEGLDFFRSYFVKVSKSKFLTGNAEGRNGTAPFRADFEWLMKPSSFAKVLEGKYHR